MPEGIDPQFADFRNFVYYLWTGYLQLPKPTPVQLDAGLYLQHGPKRLIIEMFRGAGKTWITAAFVAWTLLLDPQKKILVVSATASHAENITKFILQLISDEPCLAHLRPKEGQRSSVLKFDVGPSDADVAPSVRAAGINGTITGGRADLIVGDDIEVSTNSATQVMRDKNAEAVKEFDAILKPTPDSRVIFLGTPHTENSIYNVLGDRGYDTRIWPVRYPLPEKMEAYGTKLAPMIRLALLNDPELPGSPTEPSRFGELDLLEREASFGRSGFAMQYQLDTALSDAQRYPLKVQDLVVMSCNPESAPEKIVWCAAPEKEAKDLPNVAMLGDRFYQPMQTQGDWLPYQSIVMAVDPSGRGTDETTYCILGALNSQLFLLDMGGFFGGYTDKTLEALAKKASQYKANRLLIESNFGDGMFSKLLMPFLRRYRPVTIEEIRHSTMKEQRIIDTLEPVMNQHRLIVDPEVIKHDYRSLDHLPVEEAKNYQLIYQMTRITREKGALRHDDRLDCLAMAVAHYTEGMARDAEEEMFAHRDRELEKELMRLEGWDMADQDNWNSSYEFNGY